VGADLREPLELRPDALVRSEVAHAATEAISRELPERVSTDRT
jgi:hypothetical protein